MSEERELQDILKTLTAEQLEFIAARMYERSDRAAARSIGMSESTVYQWENREDVKRAVVLARADGVNVVREKLRRLGTDAVQVIVEEMRFKGLGNKRLDAAQDVLNRIGVDAPKKVALTDPTGTREYRSVDDLSDEELAAIATSSSSGATGAQD
jgi:DNA-binding transcriptional regulator YdaS (Cro superfamily)